MAFKRSGVELPGSTNFYHRLWLKRKRPRGRHRAGTHGKTPARYIDQARHATLSNRYAVVAKTAA